MSVGDESEALRAYERIQALLDQERGVDIDPFSSHAEAGLSEVNRGVKFSSPTTPSVPSSSTSHAHGEVPPAPVFAPGANTPASYGAPGSRTPGTTPPRAPASYASPYVSRHLHDEEDEEEMPSTAADASAADASAAYGSTLLPPRASMEGKNPTATHETTCHAVLHSLQLSRTASGERARPRRCGSVDHQAEIARLMAEAAQRSLEAAETAMHRSSGAQSAAMQEARDARAERDLWALLDLASRADLLVDVQVHDCNMSLDAALAALPASAGVADVQECSLQADTRLRKGAVLREWLEAAALDGVHEAPALGTPWQDTSEAVARGSARILSMHPDAQLALDGCMLALEGGDEAQQTALLASLWSLVRSGNLQRAQEMAYEHGALWLAASLSGATAAYYEEVGMLDGPAKLQSRQGNARRALWQQTAWSYADRLSTCPANLTRGTAASYELSLFAALSGNTTALLRSPVITHWRDRMWALVTAVHERDLAAVLERHHQRRRQHSTLYADCEAEVLDAAAELQSRFTVAGLGPEVCMDDGVSLLALSTPPALSGAIDTEVFLLSAQAAVICGRAGLNAWIRDVMPRVQFTRKGAASTLNQSRLLRVCCHLSVWLRLAAPAPSGPPADLSILPSLTDELHYKNIEMYVRHLIVSEHRELAAAYVSYLPQPRRLRAYARLLRSIPNKGAGEAPGAAEALAQARAYFPAAEVLRMASAAAQMSDAEADADDEYLEIESMVVEQPVTSSVTAAPARRQPADAQHALQSPNNLLRSAGKHRRSREDSATEEQKGLAGSEGGPDHVRLQRLQWLLHDPVHRLEAIRQATRTLTALMLEGKVMTARQLLFRQLPQDSETRGWQILALERQRLSDAQAAWLEENMGATALPAPLAEEQQKLISLELQWESDLRQLWFWRRCLTALDDADKATGVAADITTTRQHTLARVQSQLERAGQEASASLLQALQCGGSRPEESSVSGVAQVWHDAEACAVRASERALGALVVAQAAAGADGTAQPAAEASFVGLPSRADLVARLHSLKSKLECVFVASGGADHSTDTRRRAAHRTALLAVYAGLEACLAATEESDADGRARMCEALVLCEGTLAEVSEVRAVGRKAVAHLVTRYLDVCERAAEALERLVTSSGTSAQHVHFWYARGCRVAEVLSDSDPSLELYSFLPVEALRGALDRIGHCALKSMEVRGNFDVGGTDV